MCNQPLQLYFIFVCVLLRGKSSLLQEGRGVFGSNSHVPLYVLQKEEERLRASIRRESQQRRMREKQHQRGLSSSYLEPDRYDDEDEGEEAISLAAIKSTYKSGGLRGKFDTLF